METERKFSAVGIWARSLTLEVMVMCLFLTFIAWNILRTQIEGANLFLGIMMATELAIILIWSGWFFITKPKMVRLCPAWIGTANWILISIGIFLPLIIELLRD